MLEDSLFAGMATARKKGRIPTHRTRVIRRVSKGGDRPTVEAIRAIGDVLDHLACRKAEQCASVSRRRCGEQGLASGLSREPQMGPGALRQKARKSVVGARKIAAFVEIGGLSRPAQSARTSHAHQGAAPGARQSAGAVVGTIGDVDAAVRRTN